MIVSEGAFPSLWRNPLVLLLRPLISEAIHKSELRWSVSVRQGRKLMQKNPFPFPLLGNYEHKCLVRLRCLNWCNWVQLEGMYFTWRKTLDVECWHPLLNFPYVWISGFWPLWIGKLSLHVFMAANTFWMRLKLFHEYKACCFSWVFCWS